MFVSIYTENHKALSLHHNECADTYITPKPHNQCVDTCKPAYHQKTLHISGIQSGLSATNCAQTLAKT
jgi:hypothetical protein